MDFYKFDNTHGIICESDDVLQLPKPLGPALVDERLRICEWLVIFLRYDWAPLGEENYVDAYAAVARIIVIAAAIRSTHPDDLAYALGLPTWFVRLTLLALKSDNWVERLYSEVLKAANEPADVGLIKHLIDEWMTVEFEPRLDWLDVLKAVGVEILGLGKAPFELKLEDDRIERIAWRDKLSVQEASVFLPAVSDLL